MRHAPASEGPTARTRWGRVLGRLRQWDESVLLRAEAEDSIVAYLMLGAPAATAVERSGRLDKLGPISAALVA